MTVNPRLDTSPENYQRVKCREKLESFDTFPQPNAIADELVK
jgi:hypothetical protein